MYAAELRTIQLGGRVRDVLPNLTHKSRNFTGRTICPTCGGHKSRTAHRCIACFQNMVRVLKSQERTHQPLPQTYPSRKWRLGSEGTTPTQPSRPMMVKKADGTWTAAE